jgi:zinc transporter 2
MTDATPPVDRKSERLSKSHGLLDHEHHDDGGSGRTRSTQVLRKLQRACVLCSLFLLVEVVGGLASGSLAILSDAAHLAADLAGFGVAIGASYLAALPKTEHYTFGLQRVESLAALLSMLSLAFISVALGVEALRRTYSLLVMGQDLVPVEGTLMSGVAFLGVLVNVALAFVLGEHHVHLPSDDATCSGGHDHGHAHAAVPAATDDDDDAACSGDHNGHSHGHAHADEATPLVTAATTTQDKSSAHNHHDDSLAPIPFLPQNINLRAAYLHVLGDLAQSVAVLIAGVLIWIFPSWTILDPLCTLLFCALVGYSTVGVLRTSVAVLLQEVPRSVDWQAVYDAIDAIPGVSNVHDLHIWSIAHGIPTLSVHCAADDPTVALEEIYRVCARDFGIVHATIQVQSMADGNDAECITCTDRICRLCQLAEENDNNSREASSSHAHTLHQHSA